QRLPDARGSRSWRALASGSVGRAGSASRRVRDNSALLPVVAARCSRSDIRRWGRTGSSEFVLPQPRLRITLIAKRGRGGEGLFVGALDLAARGRRTEPFDALGAGDAAEHLVCEAGEFGARADGRPVLERRGCRFADLGLEFLLGLAGALVATEELSG